MELINIEFKKEDNANELIKLLTGEIFHLRSFKDFKKIISDNFIYSNTNGRYIRSNSSENCFGGNRGYVCLIDLVNKPLDHIVKSLNLYNFIEPSWLKDVKETHNEYCVCYFVLDREIYDKIIPNEVGRLQHEKTGEKYIPDIEVWYPTPICLDDISKVFLVKIIENFNNNNEFGRSFELYSRKDTLLR